MTNWAEEIPSISSNIDIEKVHSWKIGIFKWKVKQLNFNIKVKSSKTFNVWFSNFHHSWYSIMRIWSDFFRYENPHKFSNFLLCSSLSAKNQDWVVVEIPSRFVVVIHNISSIASPSPLESSISSPDDAH